MAKKAVDKRKLIREFVKLILVEANEYQWDVATDQNLMLKDEGMEKSDRENVSHYLKSILLMKNDAK